MPFIVSQQPRAQNSTFTVNYSVSPPCESSTPEQSRLRGLIEDIVSDVFAVEASQLRQATRGRARIALARQVAMYIAHVGYGLSLTEVGRLFERDRTTVAHACYVVEHKRDDETFDRAVVLLEMIIRTVSGSGALSKTDEAMCCADAGDMLGGPHLL